MEILHLKKGKITDIKQNYFSYYSNNKKIANNNYKNNSVDGVTNKVNLKKNNKIETDNKKNTIGNITNKIIYSNESLQRMSEKNFFKNLLNKFTKYKEDKKVRNFSFTNNLINRKVTQFEENINLSKNQQKIGKSLNENKEDINIINNLSKVYNSSKKSNLFLNKNLNLKENVKEDNTGIIQNKSKKGRNSIFNKYISNNIINNLNGFNKIKDLIKTHGFSINIKDVKEIKSGYNDNNIEEDKSFSTIRLEVRKMMGLQKSEKEEIFKSSKKEVYPSIKLKENPGKINKNLSRNIFFPLIKSEDKEKNIKLSIALNIFNNKNEIKDFKYFNKELHIKREVNKYFQKKNYKSLKEFYKEWLKSNKNYLTINDIDYFLNKKIKIPIHVTREEMHKIFFNNVNSEHFDFNNFKNIFRVCEIFNKESDETKKDEKLSKEDLINNEKKIIDKILNLKEYLYNKIEEKKGSKIYLNRDKYLLNYDEFYNLIKNNLAYQDKYLDIVLRKIYADNFDKRQNKMDFLKFIFIKSSESNNIMENEKNVNHSEIDNSFNIKTEKKFLRRINSFKDNYKNIFKIKPKEKSEYLIKSESKKTNLKKSDTRIFVNNSIEFDYLNNVSKLSSFNYKFKTKKHKNSDIINII